MAAIRASEVGVISSMGSVLVHAMGANDPDEDAARDCARRMPCKLGRKIAITTTLIPQRVIAKRLRPSRVPLLYPNVGGKDRRLPTWHDYVRGCSEGQGTARFSGWTSSLECAGAGTCG